MATTNFYLKSPANKENTLIYLFFSFNGQRLKFSTGESINPKNWNFERQRVKKSVAGGNSINDLLNTIEAEINEIYRNGIMNKSNLTSSNIKGQLLKNLNMEVKETPKTLFFYYNEFMETYFEEKKPNTIKKYRTLENRLKLFEKATKYKITFESIDSQFYSLFRKYCITEMKYLNNTTAKFIVNFKTFLYWAKEKGYNENFKFENFKIRNDETDIIYLTESELMSLYELDLSSNIRLNNIRDTFCFACFTGLRFSDIERLKKENINDEEIHFITKKTQDSLIVPLNDFALEILKRHEYLLPVISNQKSNDYLKELGKLAGIDEITPLTQFRGVEEIKTTEPKYNFITFHTARRTFVTLSLEKGMRPEIVMSITGHKDFKTMKRYIKITSKVKLIEMKQVWRKPPGLLAI